MNVIARAFKWLVSVSDEPRTAGRIILWWEVRRIPYNVIVSVLGIISLMLFFFFISNGDVLDPGEDAVEPLALLITPILINIAYTAGWIVELTLKLLTRQENRKIGPVLFKLGLMFSIFAVFLPSAIWGIQWFAHGIN